MVSAFASTNDLLHQATTKPPTSASVCTSSNSDDEVMVGMDVDLATPLSDPSPEQHLSLSLILFITVFQISVMIIIFVSALKENSGIGVSVPKPLFHYFLSKNILFLFNFMFIPYQLPSLFFMFVSSNEVLE